MTSTQKLYALLASAIHARESCLMPNGDGQPRNAEWAPIHQSRADDLVNEHLPSGGGFDNGTQLDWDRSTSEKLVFVTAFHHMDSSGSYFGWTEHVVTVRASLAFSIDIKISGRDRNEIKDYIAECFMDCLTRDIDPQTSRVAEVEA